MTGADIESPVAAVPDIGTLFVKAAEWRLISLLFERPRSGWLEDVQGLAESCADEDLKRAAELAGRTSEGQYLDAFGPGGFVSPREAGHRVAGDPGHVLSEIEAFYSAFAFSPKTEEPADHISVEAGFIGFLSLKEAFAVSQGNSEAAGITREAAARFVENHLAAFAEPIAGTLSETTVEYLELAGKALVARTGPRPATIEGYWSPKGLCEVECPMFSCEEGEPEGETDLEEIIA